MHGFHVVFSASETCNPPSPYNPYNPHNPYNWYSLYTLYNPFNSYNLYNPYIPYNPYKPNGLTGLNSGTLAGKRYPTKYIGQILIGCLNSINEFGNVCTKRNSLSFPYSFRNSSLSSRPLFLKTSFVCLSREFQVFVVSPSVDPHPPGWIRRIMFLFLICFSFCFSEGFFQCPTLAHPCGKRKKKTNKLHHMDI